MFEQLKELSEKVKSFKDAIQNESQTRSVLIEPLLKLLGYDTANPFEVIAEYTCDVGTKKGEKVDYALMKDNDIVMLVEAKDCKVKLNEKNIGQLFRYYSVSSARVALLTNGLEYMFFTDTIKQNVMDSEPFFKFNILDFTEKDAEVVELFIKEKINADAIREHATTSAFSTAFVDFFIQQANAPTNDFVNFITKSIGLSNMNSRKGASKLVSKELAKLLTETVSIQTVKDKNQQVNQVQEAEKDGSNSKEGKKSSTRRSLNGERLTGLKLLSDLTTTNVTATKPKELLIGEKHYEVVYWADILVCLIEYAIDNGFDKDSVCLFDGTDDDTKGWIRKTSENMRTAKEIKDLGIYIETQTSTDYKLGQVKTICEKLGLSDSEVMIELI